MSTRRFDRLLTTALVSVVLVVAGLAASDAARQSTSPSPQPAASTATSATTPEATIVTTVDDGPTSADLAAIKQRLRTERTAKLRRSALRLVRGFYGDASMGLDLAASQRLSRNARQQIRWLQPQGYTVRVSSRAKGVHIVDSTQRTATLRLRLHTTDVDVCADKVRRVFDVTWHLGRIDGRWRAESINAHKRSGHEPVQQVSNCDFGQLPKLNDSYRGSSRLPHVDHPCIDSCNGPGPQGNGSYTVCADGSLSHSGGIQGACSHHGGLAGGSSSSSYPSGSSYSSSGGSTGDVYVHGYYRKDGTYVHPYTRRAP